MEQLNELEEKATAYYLPITIANQQDFKNIAQVRAYINNKVPNHNARQLMIVIMECLFGHYSTCLLPHKDLVLMFKKLFKSWTNMLYMQNRELIPPGKQYKNDELLELYIESKISMAEERIKSTTSNKSEIREAMKVERRKIANYFRPYRDLEILVSKFSFNMASRFFVVPVHLSAKICKRYVSLRDAVIESWYDIIVSLDTVKMFNPNVWFVSVEPKGAAFKMFPPDALYDMELLDSKMDSFKKWFKREKKRSLELASASNNEAVVLKTTEEWVQGMVYAKQLYNALKPRALQLSGEESNFIVEDEEEDDEYEDNNEELEGDHTYKSDEELENDEMDEDEKALQQQQFARYAAQFKHMNDIDEAAAEASGNYEAYVKKALKKQDEEAEKRAAKYAQFEEQVVEDSDVDDDDVMEDDEGNQI